MRMNRLRLLFGSVTFVLITMMTAPMAVGFESVATLTGTANVIDGDGVLFGHVEVRLQGIAAPEDNGRKRDIGGPESSANLQDFVQGKMLRCELDGTTAGKRPVGICYLAGKDIGLYQVESGHARDCPNFSDSRYAAAEKIAREAGKDLSAIYELPDYCAE